MTYMLQVENEFEDKEPDWFEIQLNQHWERHRIEVKQWLSWLLEQVIGLDLCMLVFQYLNFVGKYHLKIVIC
jgi:hypothetical protein